LGGGFIFFIIDFFLFGFKEDKNMILKHYRFLLYVIFHKSLPPHPKKNPTAFAIGLIR